MGEHGAGSVEGAKPVQVGAPAHGVRVFACELARGGADVAALERTLSAEEIARAARFGRPDLRDRYVVGRATLRALLAEALGLAPAHVPIVRGRRGRPMVRGGTIDFNVSHTSGTAVFCLAHSVRVGIDIEHRDRAVNVDGVARKFMSPREQATIAGLAGDARRHALLRLWTCKEAMSKATGDALSAPFRRLDVQSAPELALASGPPPYDPGRWRLLPVDVPGGFFTTVAVWHEPPSP
ncbi:MAG: 4'-phosphopantetheinyl transferase superfamily protein [Burkholderiales bacterium]